MKPTQLLFSFGAAIALAGGCATAVNGSDDGGFVTHPDSGATGDDSSVSGDDDSGGGGGGGGGGTDSGSHADTGGGGGGGDSGGGGGGTLPDGAPAPACYKSAQAPASCTAPTAKAGSTTCSTTAINNFIDACLVSTATDQSCQAWGATAAGSGSCGTCLKSWSLNDAAGYAVTNDRDSCYYAVLPSCKTDVKCYFDCVGAVCQTCSTQNDSTNCQAASDNGACGAHAGAADTCLQTNQSAIQVCIPQDVQGVVDFYTAACKQNAAF